MLDDGLKRNFYAVYFVQQMPELFLIVFIVVDQRLHLRVFAWLHPIDRHAIEVLRECFKPEFAQHTQQTSMLLGNPGSTIVYFDVHCLLVALQPAQLPVFIVHLIVDHVSQPVSCYASAYFGRSFQDHKILVMLGEDNASLQGRNACADYHIFMVFLFHRKCELNNVSIRCRTGLK